MEEKIKTVTGQEDVKVERWFIHAKLVEPRQLDFFQEKGVKTIHVNNIIEEIKEHPLKNFVGDKRVKQLFDIMGEDI